MLKEEAHSSWKNVAKLAKKKKNDIYSFYRV